MSSNFNNAGNRGARADASSWSEGVRQDPREVDVELRHDGWSEPIGHGHALRQHERTRTEQGDVLWESLRLARLHLSRPACLFLLQGGSLAQLIDAHTRIVPAMVRGRLHLLRWKSDALWMGKAHLDDVVLAHVIDAPPTLPTPMLIASLLPRILGG